MTVALYVRGLPFKSGMLPSVYHIRGVRVNKIADIILLFFFALGRSAVFFVNVLMNFLYMIPLQEDLRTVRNGCDIAPYLDKEGVK